MKEKSSFIGKILEYAVYAILGVVALILIATILPLPGGYNVYAVQSGSMEPTIATGAIVFTAQQDSYEVGDVITYWGTDNDVSITHRIIEKRTDDGRIFYATKGDANEDVDLRQVRDREVIGKVLFDVPYAGYIVNAAKKPVGFFFIIVVPAAIIIYDEIVKLYKELTKRKKSHVQHKEDTPSRDDVNNDTTDV